VYDAVLFDMDGVLLTGRHTDPAVYERAAERVLDTRGISDPPADLVEAFISPGTADAFRAAAERYELPADDVWAARERVASELEAERIAAGEREPFPDIGALDALPSLGVVSNNRQQTVSFTVDHLSLDAAVAVGRDPTLAGFERLKPDPYYVLSALDTLAVESVLYVGDRYTDVAAAHAAGADAALLDRPGLDAGEALAQPEHVVDSLDAVPELEPA